MAQTTLSPHEVPHADPTASRRWRRLERERRFRTAQLAQLESQIAADPRHDAVKGALRIAARAALNDTEAALARFADGSYGRCVTCGQSIPDSRLDVLPMAALCMPCHYNEQNCHAGGPPAEDFA